MTCEAVLYNRALYGKSERERLRRINYRRKRLGMPQVASLAEVKLRKPMEAR